MKTYMNDAVFLKMGFEITNDKSKINFDTVYNYLNEESYWAQGIPPAKLKHAIEHSICFSILQQQEQVGFARVITDQATFAYICDVFILPKARGNGLSKWLLQTIMNHPELQGLRRWSLATLDAHGLYKQFGFNEISKPDRWMEIFKPYSINN